jgi:hypothetical protein
MVRGAIAFADASRGTNLFNKVQLLSGAALTT